MKKSIYLLFFISTFCAPVRYASAQFYNGSQMEFGKNRVQYNGFQWQYQNYERFKIYYYTGGKNHSVYVAQAAHQHLQQIEKLFDFYLEGQIEFVVYNTQSHYRQSNVGITGDEMYNIGGVTRIVGNKVFLYYEGDHKKFDKQIRAGIANILLFQMMYGGNWRDVLKNQTLLTLPDWFLQGFVSYVSQPWDVETEGYVKDGVISGKFDRFYRCEGLDAQYAGHAMWNYIGEVYGEGVIPNILYMTRISRNVESGFLFVLGISLRKMSTQFVEYYKIKFDGDNHNQVSPSQEPLPIPAKSKYVYRQFKMSPDGRYAAFATNEMGQYKIWLYDISKKELKRIAKGDLKLNRLNDYSFPVLGWHPTGNGLAYFVEKKGEILFCMYTLSEEKTTKKALSKLDKVLSFDYADDGKSMVISGVSMGQTDLYSFKPLGNSIEQITNDFYDDVHPKFVHQSTAIIFASNRPNDTLQREVKIKPGNHNKDIFVYNLKNNNRIFNRITRTPNADESWPSMIDSMNYTYLSDENGVINRYRSFYDSTISSVDTIVHYTYFTKTTALSNYNRNILEYDVNEKKGKYAFLMLKDGQYNFYTGQVKDDGKGLGALPDTRFRTMEKMMMGKSSEKTEVPVKTETEKVEITEKKDSSGVIDINNYEFSNDKPKYEKQTVKIEETTIKKDTVSKKKQVDTEFKEAPQGLYKINFATDYIVSQLDNSYLNQTYQRYTPGGQYFNPGINGLIKMGISDVFEDHRIIGGFRYSGNLSSNEYMLMYEDLSKRLDKKYILYRQAFNAYARDLGITKTQIHEAKVALKYPFNEVLCLRGTFGYRNDRVVTLATDYPTLDEPNTHYHMSTNKLELIYDNTVKKGLNLYNGLRLKVWGEYYKEFITEKSDFIVTGFDVRHYLKIHRDFIWANRIAASASMGNKRLVYFLGGVDNWIVPQFDPSIQVPTDQNYGYQTIATPMRGFEQNARNGSNMAIINSELRMPLFKYFAEQPLKSDFLENFQVVSFFDIGTAWTGWNPYSDENSFNTTVIASPGNPIYVILENQREPIVYGYGWGLRSRLFGYFIRFDWARGIDDGAKQDPIKYFSLSLDF
ncbi:MAG: hypothetical protein ACOZCO_08775 [Bacteroidota bacterium]